MRFRSCRADDTVTATHAFAGLISFAVTCVGAVDRPVRKRATDEKQMEPLWADLEQEDVEASRPLLELADRPQEAVTLLNRKLNRDVDTGLVSVLLLLRDSEQDLCDAARNTFSVLTIVFKFPFV
jgi:hypothetical protein